MHTRTARGIQGGRAKAHVGVEAGAPRSVKTNSSTTNQEGRYFKAPLPCFTNDSLITSGEAYLYKHLGIAAV